MSPWVDLLRGVAWFVCIAGGVFFSLILLAGTVQQIIDWARRGR